MTAEPVFCPSLQGAWLFASERTRELGDRLEELDEVLVEEGFDEEEQPVGPGGWWSLGTLEITGERRPIWKGFLEPILRVPLVPASARVLAYLISLPDRDFLHRENHGWGWHYHYLNANEERSDTVLCWDTLTPAPKKPGMRGLFQEKHGQGFKARPTLWGHTKRRSMHEACVPDLLRPIIEFRHPTQKAVAVWPIGLPLTPRVADAAPPPPRFPSGNHRRGRRK